MTKKAGFKNEEDKQHDPAGGSTTGESSSLGCDDFKKEAHDIAYGQASKSGCKSDQSKFKSQEKDYHWSE